MIRKNRKKFREPRLPKSEEREMVKGKVREVVRNQVTQGFVDSSGRFGLGVARETTGKFGRKRI